MCHRKSISWTYLINVLDIEFLLLYTVLSCSLSGRTNKHEVLFNWFWSNHMIETWQHWQHFTFYLARVILHVIMDSLIESNIRADPSNQCWKLYLFRILIRIFWWWGIKNCHQLSNIFYIFKLFFLQQKIMKEFVLAYHEHRKWIQWFILMFTFFCIDIFNQIEDYKKSLPSFLLRNFSRLSD